MFSFFWYVLICLLWLLVKPYDNWALYFHQVVKLFPLNIYKYTYVHCAISIRTTVWALHFHLWFFSSKYIVALWRFTYAFQFSFLQSYWDRLAVSVRAYRRCRSFVKQSLTYLVTHYLCSIFISSVVCNAAFMVQQFLCLTICICIYMFLRKNTM